MSSTLVIIDLQNDFCNGVFKNPQVGALIENINHFVETSLYSNLVFTLDTHTPDTYDEPFPIHCLRNSHGWKLIHPLSQFQDEPSSNFDFQSIKFIEKSHFAADEQSWIDAISPNTKFIHIIGTATEYCVLENYKILKRLFPNAEVKVLEKYCIGLDYNKSQEALAEMDVIPAFIPSETYRGLINFINIKFLEFGTDKKAVLGVSGGKDSSVCLKLLVDALGKDKVIPVLIPNGAQSDIDCSHSICKFCGVEPVEINIGSTYKSLSETMMKELNLSSLPSTYTTNTPARLRMTVLYGIAAIMNGIVINTCNLSEDYVGYSTKFGDSAGDMSLLSRLTCGEVIKLGEYMRIPDELIHKPPSDGMCGKTDEDNLGFTYSMLDAYIRHLTLIPDDVEKVIVKKHNHGATKHKAMLIPECNVYNYIRN